MIPPTLAKRSRRCPHCTVLLLGLLTLVPAAHGDESVRALARRFRAARPAAERIAAARALGRRGPAARGVVPILVEGLDDPDAAVSASAAEALGRIGDRLAHPALVKLLIGRLAPEASVARAEAARAIARLADPGAADALRRAIRMVPPEPEAVDVLLTLEGRGALPFLVTQLSSIDRRLQQRIARGLGRLGDPAALPYLARLMKQTDPGLLEAVVYGLGRIGGRAAVKPLSAYIAQPTSKRQPTVTRLAVGALARQPDPAAREALELLIISPDPRTRADAVTALGRIGDPASVTPLTRAMRDPSWVVRGRLARALGLIGAPDGLPLLKTLATDRQRHVRVDAAHGLGRCALPGARPTLAQLLADPAAAVRRAALTAVRTLGGPQAQAPLLAGVSDKDPAVRAEAALGLGELRFARELHLLRLAGDENVAVRRAAAQALARLGTPLIGDRLGPRLAAETDQRARHWLHAAQVRADRSAGRAPSPASSQALAKALRQAVDPALLAAATLGRPGNDALAELGRRITGARRAQRPSLVAALAALPLDGTPRLLGDVLEAAPFDELTRHAAIRVLGQLPSAAAVRLLRGQLLARSGPQPPDGWQRVMLRRAALRALFRIGDPEAALATTRAWDDPNPGVRSLALRLLSGFAREARKPLEARLQRAAAPERRWLTRALARMAR